MSNVAVLFPGQGSQEVGMGQAFYEQFDECRALWEQADEILGYSLSEICFEGPQENLTRSSHAQPAIFVHSIAAWTCLKKTVPDLNVQAAAGLSSGEWSALYIAGVLSFEDTLSVLEARGKFMQEACDAEPGAMLSVMGLDFDKLGQVAEDADVELANLNSPVQTVLSGTRDGIKKAEELAKEAGARRAIPLNVAGAFHSRLMTPAAERLAEFLESVAFQAPAIPVISNVTGEPHAEPTAIKDLMVKQVISSVQWVKDIEYLTGQGIRSFFECGPGQVLSGLVKRIDKETRVHNIQDPGGLEGAAEFLNS